MATPKHTLASHLDALYDSKVPTRRWQHRSRRDWMIEAIRRWVPERVERALEVGAGAGVFLPTLVDRAHQVSVIDIDPDCVAALAERARAHPQVTVVADDVTQSRLEAGRFDFILCSQVIEHIPDVGAAIGGMRRLLRPGGLLFIGTPQKYSLLEMTEKIALLPGIIHLVRLVYRESVVDPGHVSLMTRAQLRRRLRAAGFEIVEQHTSGFYVPLVSDLGGEAGLRVARFLERTLRDSPLGWMLSTQAYVAVAR